MKVDIIGGGPAGLYFSVLLKKSFPQAEVSVTERNRADDTFGFGIVLSEETLNNLRAADEASYRDIAANFAYWDDIHTHYRGQVLRSSGHGFSGIKRLTLLQILQRRAASLGVNIAYQTEDKGLASHRDADLIVAADGINSPVRESLIEHFRPTVDLRSNKFVWLGAHQRLPGFTYSFRENECGIWNLHAYMYAEGECTLVVETTDEAFTKSGLGIQDEQATAAYVERLFAEELRGADGRPGKVLTNRSHWRNFPTIACATWHHENIVLLGDAAHTAHFTIGSGTKLALEDAIALHAALLQHADAPRAALPAYEAARREEAERIQHSANVSLVFFENVRRFWHMDPVQFNFALMSRSKQITYDNLRLRDPDFIADVDRWWAGEVARSGQLTLPRDFAAPPPMFAPLSLRGMLLVNRVVVSPMCQYSAVDGTSNDWHLVHYGARALGGAGLLYTEMTCVSPDARITPGCAGMYAPEHQQWWTRIVDFVHRHSLARTCLQLGHAGRKGSTQLMWDDMDHPLPRDNWPILAASPLPYHPDSQRPREMSRADMEQVRDQFVAAARMGSACGFDMLELHMAHGYLLAGFISPLTNRRSDEYGGSLANRLRFPLEVFDAVRVVWPADRPMAVRISATDWIAGGLSAAESVEIAAIFKAHACDLIDVSTGQTDPASTPVYGRMYQTVFSEQIRNEARIATMAVGAITSADQVNTIIASGRADLCALARPHLADPSFTLRAAAEYAAMGYAIEGVSWPKQYLPAKQQLEALARRARVDAEQKQAELRRMSGHRTNAVG
ncbi:MAG: bifunctional salicylyl-CoA 5-hydroxylase/oxidoreductase [Burkholderiales bacterium]|nr:bifunctional salicylyl-CoA 5-hydroxylase/oxidoreductase [Burkholderiales bacterium]